MALVVTGKVDFGIGGQTAWPKARDRGWPLVSIGPLLTSTGGGLMPLKEGPIKRLEHLRHRRLVLPGHDLDLPILATMLEAAGLTLEDVILVDVRFALTEALLAGRVDAGFGAFVNYQQVEAERRGVAVDCICPSWSGVQDLYQLIVMTSDQMIAKHAPLVRGFSRALTWGLAFTHQYPNEALGAYLKANPMADPALSKKIFDKTRPYVPETLVQEPKRWQAVHDWLLNRKVITKPLAVATVFTNRFVPNP